MISNRSIAQVVETAQIEEVLEDFLDLRRAGSNLKGLCPFHDEKTPSFVVSPAKNIYKCFGCGEAGDSITFLREHEKLSYPEAIRWLADKYNIELEESAPDPNYQKEKEAKESLFIINEFAQKTFVDNLHTTDEGISIGLSYFKDREFSISTIKDWGMGFASGDTHQLYQLLQNNHFNLELATQIGLIKNDRDFYNSRVTFPIHNLSGKVIGFGARTLSQNKKVPKYINSPESEIYNKRKVLYGMYHAKNDIRKKDNCFLVEGYTDVIRMSTEGIPNVVAASGTSLTEDQVRLIKRFSPNITMIFDGDPAGIKASLRGMDMILAQDMNVKLVLLPEGEDPDSYCRQLGGKKYLEFLEKNAEDFILFKSKLLLEEVQNDPIQRSIAIKDIIESIAHVPDTLKRNIYVQESARLLKLEERVIQEEANKIIAKNRKKEANKIERQQFDGRGEDWQVEKKVSDQTTIVTKKQTHENQEIDLIRILFNYGEKEIKKDSGVTVAEYIFNNVSPILNYFDNPLYVSIINEIPVAISKDQTISLNRWLHHQNEAFKKLAIDLTTEKHIYADWKSRGIELQTQSPPDENYTKDTISAVLRLKLKKLKRVLHDMEKQILEVSKTKPEELKYHLTAYEEYKKDIKKLSDLLRTVVIT